jgi:hypothetical protein
MYDENLHITPDPKKGFPQPDVPADEAWNKMAGLLDAEMPASPSDQAPPSKPPTKPSSGGLFVGSLNFWGIIAGVVAVVGLLTWGIFKLNNQPETASKVHDIIKPAQNITISDSSSSMEKKEAIQSQKTISPETSDNLGNQKSSPSSESMADRSVQPVVASKQKTIQQPDATSSKGVIPEPVSKTKDERKPSGISRAQAEVRDSIVEEQGPFTPEANLRPGKDTLLEQPLTGTTSEDTTMLIKSEPMPLVPSTTVLNPPNKSVLNENDTTIAAVKVIPSETANPAASEKSKKSSGMSENLSWQMDINGNIGQVHQKGRDPNMFYGATLTGGLWNKKLNGGIETGLGWEEYKDYGSVTEHIQITDSIPVDTLGNFHYTDMYRTTGYKYNYQYLQIPLFISKQLFAAGKFSLDLKTGPLVGIMISDRITLDYTSGPEGGEILSTVDDNYTRLKISWQWQLMAQFRWNVSNRISLTLSPYGIFYLNNLYDSQNRPADLPFGIGVFGGFIYRFKSEKSEN